MSDHSKPTDSTEFNEILEQVIEAAQADGVDVEGGWKCITGDGDLHWDIQIWRVEHDEGD